MIDLEFLLEEDLLDITESEIIDDKKFAIYIVNSYSNSLIGNAIKNVTQSIYTHSALSFNETLDYLYTYGKNGNVTGGFRKEKLSVYLDEFEEAIIRVYCILVNRNKFNTMINKVDYLIDNQKKTKYNYPDFINILLNKPLENKENETEMVCSWFVANTLREAGINLFDKADNLIKPKDLANIKHPRVYFLYEGLAKNYNKNWAKDKVKRLKQTKPRFND